MEQKEKGVIIATNLSLNMSERTNERVVIINSKAHEHTVLTSYYSSLIFYFLKNATKSKNDLENITTIIYKLFEKNLFSRSLFLNFPLNTYGIS